MMNLFAQKLKGRQVVDRSTENCGATKKSWSKEQEILVCVLYHLASHSGLQVDARIQQTHTHLRETARPTGILLDQSKSQASYSPSTKPEPSTTAALPKSTNMV